MIDKPVGWTSHDVVAAVRRRFGIRRVGHAGTLDPFATGLLVVLLGKATRLARFVEGLPKRYEAVAQLGIVTTTDDATGDVVAEAVPEQWQEASAVARVLAEFAGQGMQRPPAYSAKHVDGVRSYRLARSGAAVVLPTVPIEVYRIAMTAWNPPELTFEATVSRGTYVRSLARDIGERFGTGAHCSALRRTHIGHFAVEHATGPRDGTPEQLIAPADIVMHLPRQVLSADEAREVSFGRSVVHEAESDQMVALVDHGGQLLAIGEPRDGRCHPAVVLEAAA